MAGDSIPVASAPKTSTASTTVNPEVNLTPSKHTSKWTYTVAPAMGIAFAAIEKFALELGPKQSCVAGALVAITVQGLKSYYESDKVRQATVAVFLSNERRETVQRVEQKRQNYIDLLSKDIPAEFKREAEVLNEQLVRLPDNFTIQQLAQLQSKIKASKLLLARIEKSRLDQRVAELTQAKVHAETELTNKTVELTLCQEQLAIANAEIQKLTAGLARVTERVRSLEAELVLSETQAKNLSLSIQQKNALINQLSEESKRQKAVIDQLVEESGSQKAVINQLNAEREEQKVLNAMLMEKLGLSTEDVQRRRATANSAAVLQSPPAAALPKEAPAPTPIFKPIAIRPGAATPTKEVAPPAKKIEEFNFSDFDEMGSNIPPDEANFNKLLEAANAVAQKELPPHMPVALQTPANPGLLQSDEENIPAAARRWKSASNALPEKPERK